MFGLPDYVRYIEEFLKKLRSFGVRVHCWFQLRGTNVSNVHNDKAFTNEACDEMFIRKQICSAMAINYKCCLMYFICQTLVE